MSEDFSDEYKDMDRKQIPYFEKDKGKEFFDNKKYFEAANHYSKAVMGYQFLIKDGKIHTQEELEKYTQEVYFPSNLNLSICYMKLQDYSTALNFAEKALEVEPNNVKGLFRKATCLMYMQEYDDSIKVFKNLIEIDPENEEFQKSLQMTIQKKQKMLERQKKIGESMIKGIDYQDKIIKQQQEDETKNDNIIRKMWKMITNLCQRKKKQE